MTLDTNAEPYTGTWATRSEVAATFQVDPATVSRWDRKGRLGSRDATPGGQRRYRIDEIDKLWPGFAARLQNVRAAR